MLVLIPRHSKTEKGTRLTDCHSLKSLNYKRYKASKRDSVNCKLFIALLLNKEIPYIMGFLCRIVDYGVKDSINII